MLRHNKKERDVNKKFAARQLLVSVILVEYAAETIWRLDYCGRLLVPSLWKLMMAIKSEDSYFQGMLTTFLKIVISSCNVPRVILFSAASAIFVSLKIKCYVQMKILLKRRNYISEKFKKTVFCKLSLLCVGVGIFPSYQVCQKRCLFPLSLRRAGNACLIYSKIKKTRALGKKETTNKVPPYVDVVHAHYAIRNAYKLLKKVLLQKRRLQMATFNRFMHFIIPFTTFT